MELNVSSSSVNATSTGLCTDDWNTVVLFCCWFICKNIFVLPLCANILHVGFQQWKRHSFKKTSNCDLFIYNLSIMELISCLGGIIFLCGVFVYNHEMITVGYQLFFEILPSETVTHSLLCSDVYFAVVHPVFYLKSRKTTGRICKICILAIWVGTFVLIPLEFFKFNGTPTFLCLTVFGINLVIVFYCTFSVLKVLLQSGPSDNGKVDKCKRKAFYTILVIFMMSLIWFVGFAATLLIIKSHVLDFNTSCLIFVSAFWFSLVSSFVSPVIFLQKHKKMTCCYNRVK